jgi:hypothetical protein
MTINLGLVPPLSQPKSTPFVNKMEMMSKLSFNDDGRTGTKVRCLGSLVGVLVPSQRGSESERTAFSCNL